MKRKSLVIVLSILVFYTTSIFAQLDILHFNKLQIGAMYDKTNVTGAYYLQDPKTNLLTADIKDFRTTINAELKVTHSTPTYVTSANLEGLLYILGRLASLGEKDELFNDFDTYLDPLSASELDKIVIQKGGNEKAILSNNHIVDIYSSWAFKRDGKIFGGVNGALRTLGFAPRYTNYKLEKPENMYVITAMSGTWKILYGLNIGYRTNLGKKMSFLCMAGVNRGINKSNSDPNNSSAIQILYNPFIQPTLFIGGKHGVYTGIYYEYMKGRDSQAIGPAANMNVGASDLSGGIPTKSKVNENQILVKLGVYFGTKNEK